jgi:CRP-like cAMP-binding protein
MFILLKGEVEISKSLFMAPLSHEDSLQEKSLIRLNEDQHAFFGEMALFLENPERSASIKALRPCKLATIQKQNLVSLLNEDHYLGSILYKNVAAELTKRLIKANRDVLKLTTAFSLALEGE